MKHHFRIDVEVDTERTLSEDEIQDLEIALGALPVDFDRLKQGDTMRFGATYLAPASREDGRPELYAAAQALSDATINLDDEERLDLFEWALTRSASIVAEKKGIVYEPHDFEGTTQACAKCGRGRRDRLHCGG